MVSGYSGDLSLAKNSDVKIPFLIISGLRDNATQRVLADAVERVKTLAESDQGMAGQVIVLF